MLPDAMETGQPRCSSTRSSERHRNIRQFLDRWRRLGWTPSSKPLNASGCSGGMVATAACAQGTPIPLTDDMHFLFTFDSATTLDDTTPKLKVHFLDASFKKRDR